MKYVAFLLILLDGPKEAEKGTGNQGEDAFSS